MAYCWGFPGGSVVKNLPANIGDTKDAGSTPGLKRSPGEGNSWSIYLLFVCMCVPFKMGWCWMLIFRNNVDDLYECEIFQTLWLNKNDSFNFANCKVLAWRIPWTEETGGLQFQGLQRIGHGSATEHARMHHVLLLENVVGLEMLDLGHCFQKPPSTHCVMFPHLALLSCDSLTKHHKLGGSRPQGYILQQF